MDIWINDITILYIMVNNSPKQVWNLHTKIH